MQAATEAAKSVHVSVEEAYGELQRETQVRARCFDRWVDDGKLAWTDARDRMARIAFATALFKHMLDTESAFIDQCSKTYYASLATSSKATKST
jgi:hypothetical protein